MSQTRIAISQECMSEYFRFALKIEVHRRLTAEEARDLRKQIADACQTLQRELDQKLSEQ
jgi:hypothetical protein